VATQAAQAAAEQELEEGVQGGLVAAVPMELPLQPASLIMFECPLGLPALAPLASLHLLLAAEGDGRSDEDTEGMAFHQLHLVAPSLLIAVAAAAARAAVAAPSGPDSVVLLADGVMLPQVRVCGMMQGALAIYRLPV
jgi:hypothetical protein